jgi:hypothetical protein
MSVTESEYTPAPEYRPRTITVLTVLIAAAAGFSYLGAYAVANALKQAEVITWPAGTDPRPRWMVFGFATLLALFLAISILLRRMSKRQLRRIDELAEEAAEETRGGDQPFFTAKSEH